MSKELKKRDTGRQGGREGKEEEMGESRREGVGMGRRKKCKEYLPVFRINGGTGVP